MLDIKFLRENPEIVKQNIRNKFQDHKLPLVDEVIQLDEENRRTIFVQTATRSPDRSVNSCGKAKRKRPWLSRSR